jgi:ceramide glucosyltransferase
MGAESVAFALWLALSTLMLVGPTLLGALRMRSSSCDSQPEEAPKRRLRCEVLVALKGVFKGQDAILSSLVNQTHPAYSVIFILESESDPANEVVDRLCRGASIARKTISRISHRCAQKNQSLIAGLTNLRPDTEVIVFCDGTNKADSGWLERFVRPLDLGESEAVTTHRDFEPLPPTLGGVCQTLYGAIMRIGQWIFPMPWGGGTAIRRDAFERLGIVPVWATNVNDDLVLGNSIRRCDIGMKVDLCNRLRTPLHNQSLKGFLIFLDRQVMNPKFTNPVFWLVLLLMVGNTFILAMTVTLLPVGFFLGICEGVCCWVALASFVLLVSGLLLLRSIHPVAIPLPIWFAASFVALALCAYVCLRSIFRDYIFWHGRTYRAGRGGVVQEVLFDA